MASGEDERSTWGPVPDAPHAEPAERVVDALGTGDGGLSGSEAEKRLDEGGPNELHEEDAVSPLAVFVAQFQDALVYLLAAAAVLSVAVGFLPGQEPEYTEAGLIVAILLANGIFGFVQDYRAEQSLRALRDRATPAATVLRDGERREIDAREVVPGDVLVIETGDAIPADARLIESASLETDESTLTGESTTVSKDPAPVDADAPLAERADMVYRNTTAVAGRGKAVVVATGMDTEVGAIATEIAAASDGETPFEREIDRLGRRIGIGVVGLIAVLAAIQAGFTGTEPLTIVLVAVTLAVAAVPEGLPAVVTLTLALGSRKLLDQKALVRSLPVVQSLGSVDTIVTDKTGTLTENAMTVRQLYYAGATYEVGGSGTEPEGEFTRGPGESGAGSDASEVDDAESVAPLLRCGAIVNDAGEGEEGYYGDPTEIALLVSAAKAGIAPEIERAGEIPFTSDRKRMTVVVEEDGPGGEAGPTAYTKGAPGVVLERCDRILDGGDAVALTDERRRETEARIEAFAGDALRVLGFAYKAGASPDADPETIEEEMVFLGLQGMIDPPREEVPGAVADCRRAGIRVVMATGDSVETARAIGREIGFDPEGALTGTDLDAMDEDDLDAAVEDVEVFARVSPTHKVALLRALQANGHTVAMTGDGVNDAPALRNADVGVAMGERGTDVARGASDMVLLDDNFATIRTAIAEGRGIFDNVRKFVNYLLSANAGEVLVVFLGVLLGTVLFPGTFAGGGEAVVLTPVMLLWLNLVTDGLPALALGADPKAPDVMEREPMAKDEPVIDARLAASILGIGVVMTATGLVAFFARLSGTGSLVRAQTLLFTFLVAVEMVRIQVIRSRYGQSLRSNPWLVGAIVSSFCLQLAVLYTPLAGLFEVVPLDRAEWGWIGVGFLAFLALNVGVVALLDRVFAERATGPGSGDRTPGDRSDSRDR